MITFTNATKRRIFFQFIARFRERNFVALSFIFADFDEILQLESMFDLLEWTQIKYSRIIKNVPQAESKTTIAFRKWHKGRPVVRRARTCQGQISYGIFLFIANSMNIFITGIIL